MRAAIEALHRTPPPCVAMLAHPFVLAAVMPMTLDEIRAQFSASAETKQRALATLAEPTLRAAALLAARLADGRQVLACGNGGSSGDAQHLASELVNRFERERIGLPGIALTPDSSVLTAIANDYAYERVFARQIEALGRPGDVLVAFTTSGNSRNVIEAVRTAQARGLCVLALTGKDGGTLAPLLRGEDIELRVPSSSTARIQEVHLLLIHTLCTYLDQAFAADAPKAGKCHNDVATLLPLLAGRRPLVFTNGVFDLLHRGHVHYLEAARAAGACLVVGVNDDASVRRLGKGAGRPLNPLDDRMAVLAGLAAVDYVLPFTEDTPLRLIEALQPDVLVKGGDWAPEAMVGAAQVRARGGRVLSIAFAHQRSTTALVERIRGG